MHFVLLLKNLEADKRGSLNCVTTKMDSHLIMLLKEPKPDKEVVLTVVQQDGWALESAAEALRADKEIVLACIKQ